jgi:hypothetical protein
MMLSRGQTVAVSLVGVALAVVAVAAALLSGTVPMPGRALFLVVAALLLLSAAAAVGVAVAAQRAAPRQPNRSSGRPSV